MRYLYPRGSLRQAFYPPRGLRSPTIKWGLARTSRTHSVRPPHRGSAPLASRQTHRRLADCHPKNAGEIFPRTPFGSRPILNLPLVGRFGLRLAPQGGNPGFPLDVRLRRTDTPFHARIGS